MSKYTTEVRYICETAAGLSKSTGFNDIEETIARSVNSVMNFDYPIFDENYRNVLNTKILRHFYTREICEETVGLWKLRLSQTLNEIMPLYNQLYNSELENIKPFYNIDLQTERNINDNTNKNGTENTQINSTKNETKNGTGTENNNVNKRGTDTTTNKIDRNINENGSTTTKINETTTDKGTINNTIKETDKTTDEATDTIKTTGKIVVVGSTDSTDRYSDTPQGGVDGMKAVQNNIYLTNARIIDTGNSSTTNSTENTSKKHNGKENTTKNGTGKTTSDEKGTKTGNNVVTATGKNTIAETGNKTGNKNETETGTKTHNNNETKNGNTNTSQDVSNYQNINSIEKYIEHKFGYKGTKTYAELLIEWRKTFLNIDRMILSDLESCFLQIW